MQNKNEKAALYARSSKDRSDISIAAQTHALEQLAASHSLSITTRFEDAVESGATEDRPAFARLLQAIKNTHRGWSHLLVYDTSRLARRRYIAQALKHEAKKRGITILYATRPADVDPISEVVLDSMLEAMDEVHSLLSRQKGLAGMAENVRQGWRAGGRAPVGYQLKVFPTGAVREGKAVTKSKLMPADNAHQVRAFLKARARGVPRQVAAEMSSIGLRKHSLIDVEWNALTYAGHTVWNMRRDGGQGPKRKPREDWQITRGTHEALISESEAERILVNLETSDHSAALRAARAATSSFMLAGILCTTDGRTWNGHGSHYRLRKTGSQPGRIVPAGELEEAVTSTLNAFRTSDRYLAWLVDLARRDKGDGPAPSEDIAGQIRRLERERQRAAEAAIGGDDGGVYDSVVRQRTRQIDALRRELEAVEREATASTGLQTLGIRELRTLIESQDPGRVVRQLVERVVLEPTLECQVHLRRPSYNGLWRSVASPGGDRPQTLGPVLPVALRLRA